jgi:hypothetical protein
VRTNFLRLLTWCPALLLGLPALSPAAVSVSISIAPPAIPVYEQPPCPGGGYMWTPGYWAYDPALANYYWVPGTWVAAPTRGLLWTPGYWGFVDSVYVWHGGYWGPHVGFYGGIDYGFGYRGTGFEGGYWRGNTFLYNRAFVSVGRLPAAQVYVHEVPGGGRLPEGHASFNGGPGGVELRPTAAELAAERGPHRAPTPQQVRNDQAARAVPDLHANVNNGRPPIAAAPKPGAFSGPGTIAANGAAPRTVEPRATAPNGLGRQAATAHSEAPTPPGAAPRPTTTPPVAQHENPQRPAAAPTAPREAVRPQPAQAPLAHAQPARSPQAARPAAPAPRVDSPRPQARDQTRAPAIHAEAPRAAPAAREPAKAAPPQGAAHQGQPGEGERDRNHG